MGWDGMVWLGGVERYKGTVGVMIGNIFGTCRRETNAYRMSREYCHVSIRMQKSAEVGRSRQKADCIPVAVSGGALSHVGRFPHVPFKRPFHPCLDATWVSTWTSIICILPHVGKRGVYKVPK